MGHYIYIYILALPLELVIIIQKNVTFSKKKLNYSRTSERLRESEDFKKKKLFCLLMNVLPMRMGTYTRNPKTK